MGGGIGSNSDSSGRNGGDQGMSGGGEGLGHNGRDLRRREHDDGGIGSMPAGSGGSYEEMEEGEARPGG